MIQLGPAAMVDPSSPNAILNGIEILKISDSARSLDSDLAAGSSKGPGPQTNKMKIFAAIALATGITAMFLLAKSFLLLKKKHQTWNHGKSFSSWFSPLNNSKAHLLSSRTSYRSSFLSSSKSKSSFPSFLPSAGFGQSFTFKELQEAMQNFDEKAVSEAGGFGKVYLGALEDGKKKVAIKRGNTSSQQGINEFQTEIQKPPRVWHRHLV